MVPASVRGGDGVAGGLIEKQKKGKFLKCLIGWGWLERDFMLAFVDEQNEHYREMGLRHMRARPTWREQRWEIINRWKLHAMEFKKLEKISTQIQQQSQWRQWRSFYLFNINFILEIKSRVYFNRCFTSSRIICLQFSIKTFNKLHHQILVHRNQTKHMWIEEFFLSFSVGCWLVGWSM